MESEGVPIETPILRDRHGLNRGPANRISRICGCNCILGGNQRKADELEWLHRTIGSHASYAQPGDMFTSDVGILNVTVEQIRPAVARPMRMLLIAPALRPISPERDSAPLNSLPK